MPQTRRRRPRPRAFYSAALDEAERSHMAEALAVEGIDEEIALLRVRLRRAIEEHPDDFRLMSAGVDLIVKAAATRYRLSGPASDDLAESLSTTLRGIGLQLFPEGFGDG